MKKQQIMAVSPLNGRYQSKVTELNPIFSEFALIKYRLLIEIKWFQTLANNPVIKELPKFNNNILNNIINNFTPAEALKIKKIEQKTNHDVKAIEYYLQQKITKHSEFIHFGCTSEDINNLAYGLMLKEARKTVIIPTGKKLITILNRLAQRFSNQPMLAKTHGQPASPTTMGKELMNFVTRLQPQLENITKTPIMGKMNGAVGNFNAHMVAYPKINWEKLSEKFVKSLGLNWNSYTTQIEPHDKLAELCNHLALFNTILLDLCRDIWGYISLGYFTQKTKAQEVGSSVMPHKVNPIDFENAEGNLGLANALFKHFAEKLPISRWQRDLSDSTVLRNLGVAFAHSLLAYKSILSGLAKLQLNKKQLDLDLENNWQILAEAIQTIMRKHGIKNSYEKLKQFTRGKKITKQALHDFINTLQLPTKVKHELKQLTPKNYLGILF